MSYGRARGGGAGKNAGSEANSGRRTTRQTVDIDPQLSGEPPVRGRRLRSQSQDVALMEIARRGTKRVPGAQSIASVRSESNIYSDSPAFPGRGSPAAIPEDGEEVGLSRQASIARSQTQETPSKRNTRAGLMTKRLERLFEDSSELFNCLSSVREPEVFEVEHPAYSRAFAASKSNYTDGEDFIDLDYVLRTINLDMGAPQAADFALRISAANVTTLLEVLTFFDQEAQPLHRLQRWDQIFPSAFLPKALDELEPEASQGSFELALQLRTQMLIMTLQAPAPGHTYAEYVAAIFGTDTTTKDDLRAFIDKKEPLPFRPLGGLNIYDAEHPELHERYELHLRTVCKTLHKANGLARLRDEFPLESFIDDLKSWAKISFGELTAAVNAQADTVVLPLDLGANGNPRLSARAEFLQNSSPVSQPIVRATPGANRPSASTTIFEKTQQLKQLYLQARAGTPPSGQNGQGISDNELLRRKQELASSSFPAGSLPDESQTQGRFYDAPPPHDEIPTRGSFSAASAVRATDSRKRLTMVEDDEFEVDSRMPNEERRTVDQPTIKRPRVSAPSLAPPRAASVIPSTPGSQRPDDERLAREPPPASLEEPDFQAMSQRARSLAQAVRKPKEPQSRRPWSNADCATLIRAVHTFACKWSKMEDEMKTGELQFETVRDQQALRDKARLLKQDFLRTDGLLPLGFDLVVLGKKERAAVTAVGRNPDRREADVGDDGSPSNTKAI